ncbi:reverse transcriptase [Beauveria bassiana ARSEF 2860]|uniref:Reverse transcriptase n=1 Tax=Beauveria bassiana (strain ARSEF 2860) TaxID=655819 RepID=J5J9L9_BEAB2|nr:reverse transcriptase [Beauveria bassiana ARSEF 2860]EJP60776.1 reverse transcriptase [Beauveria bassiana ARSEF 2860]
MDSRLKFKQHIARASTKGLEAAMELKRLRGLSAATARQLFISTVVPLVDYASNVWMHAYQDKLVGPINRVQKAGAQAIVGTFLTVATAVAEAEANLVSVGERHRKRMIKMWLVMHTLPDTNPLRRITSRMKKFYAKHRSPLYKVARRLAAVPTDQLESILPFTIEPWRKKVTTMTDSQVDEGSSAKGDMVIATSSSARNSVVGSPGVINFWFGISTDSYFWSSQKGAGTDQQENIRQKSFYILGLSLRSCRRLHALAVVLAVALTVFHAAAAGAAKGRLDLHTPKDVFALVVIHLALRSVWYKVALRTHQILSFAFVYGLWRHASSADLFPRLYLKPAVVEAAAGESWTNASLWVPWASLGSAAQTHPFTVISWSEKLQKHLDLFIEPRGGFTKDLFALSDRGPATRRAMFNGPYGKNYQYIYMKMLLCWPPDLALLVTYRVGIAAQKLLNEALDEDKLDGEYNLRISIYINSENIVEVKFGDRATAYSGEILLANVVSSELRERRPGSKTVISVFAKCFIRDALNDLLWQIRRSNIDIMYTDY